MAYRHRRGGTGVQGSRDQTPGLVGEFLYQSLSPSPIIISVVGGRQAVKVNDANVIL